MSPSRTLFARDASSSEEAALHGQRALTPIISGAVSGGLVGLAWIIGFIIYFYKRHRREKRAIAAGFRGHREMLDPPKKPEAFIIPPDPAIVEGNLQPGDRAVSDTGSEDQLGPKHTLSMPLSDAEKGMLGGSGEATPTGTPPTEKAPEMEHSASDPGRGKSYPIHLFLPTISCYFSDLVYILQGVMVVLSRVQNLQ
ncbi:hypothetical protein BXZ70DRAFT_284580 [Cristinia sonorae]|uniref:Uncharacterized protein n=1 Tax=Cristinia sonorae TaxID=1940300 RepID=A0A8K0V0S5_9AGAR|nr:hypothetical protein BXZ70DRAFT_284580 [Cristinia sonorae]